MLNSLLISVATLTMSATDEAELKKLVLEEYPKAIIRLEETFSTARGTMTYFDEMRSGTPEQSVRSWQIEFACDGRNRKFSRRRIEGGGLYERVLARNRLYQFSLSRLNDDEPLLVQGYVAHVDNTKEFDSSWETYVASGINAPFSIGPDVRNGEFKVDRVSEVERDGLSMLKIEYHTKEDEARKLHRDQWLLVSPSQSWVIYEWSARVGTTIPGRPFSGRVEYEGRTGDIPIPRRGVSIEAPPYRDTAPFKRSFDISELQFQKTPDKDFTLTFFGLPEMGRPTKQGLNLFGYGFVAVGCVLIALAAAIKYRAARR